MVPRPGGSRRLPPLVADPGRQLAGRKLGGGDRGFELLDARDAHDGAKPAVVLLSSFDYPAFHAFAMERGAAGYLLKTAPVAEILDAMRIAASGRTAFTPHDLRSARSVLRSPSDRDLAVIRLLMAGRSNDQIGAELAIEPRTVESHLRRLFARYSVDNTATDALDPTHMLAGLACPASGPATVPT